MLLPSLFINLTVIEEYDLDVTSGPVTHQLRHTKVVCFSRRPHMSAAA
jgi:hypothetical protein